MIRKATKRISKTRSLGLLLIVFSGAISLICGISMSRTFSRGGFLDFQNIYFGTECLLHHRDPYNVGQLDGFYQKEGFDRFYKNPGHEIWQRLLYIT